MNFVTRARLKALQNSFGQGMLSQLSYKGIIIFMRTIQNQIIISSSMMPIAL